MSNYHVGIFTSGSARIENDSILQVENGQADHIQLIARVDSMIFHIHINVSDYSNTSMIGLKANIAASTSSRVPANVVEPSVMALDCYDEVQKAHFYFLPPLSDLGFADPDDEAGMDALEQTSFEEEGSLS